MLRILKELLATFTICLIQKEYLFFSQENPLCTCHSGGNRWTRDEQGNKIHLNLADYGIEGERESVWFVDNVKKYHSILSTIINTLINAGFSIERMIEPLPTDEMFQLCTEKFLIPQKIKLGMVNN